MEWRKQKLVDIASFFGDGNWIESKDQSPKGFWLVQTGNIGVISFRDKETKRFVSKETFKRLNCTEIFAGDILISRLPDPVGRACIVPKTPHRMLTAVDCSILRLKSGYDTHYINYFLNSNVSKSQVYQVVTGSSRKRISRTNLGKVEILVPFKDGKPDLAEQKRIADKLDKVFAEIERGKQKTTETNKKVISFNKSLLHDTYSNPAWQRVKLEDICDVFAGSSAPQSKTAFSSDGVFFARVSDLATKQNRLLSSTRDRIDPKEINNLRLVKAKADTTVFPKSGAAIMTNSRAMLGVDMYIVSHLAALSPKENIEPAFVYFFMLGVDMKDYIPNVSYPSLNLGTIKKIEMVMPFKNNKPDLAEQKRVVGVLDKAFALSEQLGNLFNKQGLSFASLRVSVLNKAFAPEAKVVSVPVPAQPVVAQRIFDIQQAVALVLKRFERGEMVVAKLLYFAQKIYQVPLGIQFSAQNFGPYDSTVKKAVTAGLSPRNKFFAKKGSGNTPVLSLGPNANKILKYANSSLARKMNGYLDAAMPYFSNRDSGSIERLATICKIIEDTKTTDEKVIREKLHEWKPNRFQDAEVSRTIAFIKQQKWDTKLIT